MTRTMTVADDVLCMYIRREVYSAWTIVPCSIHHNEWGYDDSDDDGIRAEANEDVDYVNRKIQFGLINKFHLHRNRQEQS